MTAPTCINHGCNKPVTYSHKDAQGNPRWRIHCGHCQKASYGAHAHASGVTPWKTGKCSNHDSHLGFPCCIDYENAPWALGMTEVDHKDGNHANHSHDNLDELCPMCHKRKGQVSGDYNNQKKKSTTKHVSSDKLKKLEGFNRVFGFLEADNDEDIIYNYTDRVANG